MAGYSYQERNGSMLTVQNPSVTNLAQPEESSWVLKPFFPLLFLTKKEMHAVRPGATGLLTDMEYSRVGSTAWVRPTSTVTTRTAVELA